MLVFWDNCVNWPYRHVETLTTMIEGATAIGRDAFLRRVNSHQMHYLEAALGYDDHLSMASDYHVTYHIAHIEGGGVPTAFFVHSGVEFVFAPWLYLNKKATHRTDLETAVPWATSKIKTRKAEP